VDLIKKICYKIYKQHVAKSLVSQVTLTYYIFAHMSLNSP